MAHLVTPFLTVALGTELQVLGADEAARSQRPDPAVSGRLRRQPWVRPALGRKRRFPGGQLVWPGLRTELRGQVTMGSSLSSG